MPSENEFLPEASNRNPELEQKIKQLIGAELPDIFCFNSVSSVMDAAKKLYRQTNCIILASSQTDGRGQYGREWNSPEGALLACLCFPLKAGIQQQLQGLSLVIALQIRNLLEESGLKSKVKWPNDILIEGSNKKICGILLETSAGSQNQSYLKIGIGLNVFRHPDYATSIYNEIQKTISIEILTSKIYGKIRSAMDLFMQHGFVVFRDEWNTNDIYINKQIIFQASSKNYDGIYLGVDSQANLLLQDKKNIQKFTSGRIVPV